jgi:16S rRNA (guanine(966)-N(2))-methyltransferase RsmD
MRIITGSRRGKRLKTLEGMAVRPTSDHIKESLFNILQFDIEGRAFLDLFAGSGQIGLEALSRGADHAVFVDSAKTSCAVVQDNIKTTELSSQARVVQADYASFLMRNTERFDIAFLDPPYRTGILEKALCAVVPHMNRGGIVVCEHPTDETLPEKAGEFVKVKDYRYGKILLTTYRHESLV